MQSQTIHKNIGLILYVAAFVAVLFFSIGAHAQGNYDPYSGGNNGGYYGRSNQRVSNNDIRKAYDHGYKDGYKIGKNDAKSRSGGYNRNGGYGNAGTYGNSRWGGGQLQRAYQDGYQRGYQEGYDRNRRNNRYSRYGNRTIFGFPLPY